MPSTYESTKSWAPTHDPIALSAQVQDFNNVFNKYILFTLLLGFETRNMEYSKIPAGDKK